MALMSRYKCKKCGKVVPGSIDIIATKCPECGASKWKMYDEKEMAKDFLKDKLRR